MKSYVYILVLSIAAFHITVQKSTEESPSYVAAVVEYSPDIYDVTGTDILTQNAKQYVNLIQNASRQEADIIVFPECGLAALQSSTRLNNSSIIPDPEDNVVPCDDPSSPVHESVRLLSCAARDNDIYVVVNIPEKKPCSQSTPSNCTTLYYNTDVVFDRKGFIVARYRKYNLFGEPGFSATDTPDIATFKTDFGVTFGIFTCFDIMFEKPATTLVKENGITDVVFPTAWFSELPFLSAVQEQAAWSHGLNVNFLGAGYNHPSGGSTGSGIYAGEKGVLISIMATEATTQLLVAKVPKKTSQNVTISSKFPSIKVSSKESRIFFKKDFLDPYTTKQLANGSIDERICHGDFCCTFTGKMKKSSTLGYNYRLVVFDGIRSFTFKTGGLQVCAVIFCANDSLASCGEEIDSPVAFSTIFESIKVSGDFQLENATQLPNTLLQGYEVLQPTNYLFTRQEDPRNNLVTIVMETTSSQALSNVLTFGIYGRNFLTDGQRADSGTNAISQSAMTIILCLIIMTVFTKSV